MSKDFFSIPGAIAGENLSSDQFRFVLMNATDYQVAGMSSAATERPVGILQNDPTVAGQAAEVAYSGAAKVEYGGNVTAGDTLVSDDNGKAIKDVEVTAGSAHDLHHMATALVTGVDGDIEIVLVHTPHLIGKA